MEKIKEGYVRVSNLLAPYNDFSKIPPQILQRKAQIGTDVHAFIEACLKDEFICIDEEPLEYIQAFRNFSNRKEWYQQLKPNINLIEKRMYSETYKITGKVDFIGSYKGKNTLIDWKTTYTPSIRNWQMQTALYSLILKENKIKIEQAYVIQLKKDGEYVTFKITLSDKILALATNIIDIYWHYHSA